MARSKKKPKKAVVQQSLEQGNLLPLLKKPMTTIGVKLQLPGKAWGSNCPRGDVEKLFHATVVDFELNRKFDEGKSTEFFKDAVKLTEMGTDGTGGHSVDFWMHYPHPFLQYWYAAFPEQLPARAGGAHAAAAAATPMIVDDEEDVAEGKDPTDESTNEKVYTHLDLLRTFRVTDKKSKQFGRTCGKFACTVVRQATGLARHGQACRSSVTIWGKSTGAFFKHCRRFAKRGCAGHIEVLKELNLLSARQVAMPDGSFVTVQNFKEAFPHHIRFVWLVADGMPQRNSRKPLFRNFIRGFEPRAVLPSSVSVHRIAQMIDEIQLGKQQHRRAKHILSNGGMPCIGLQLDLFTDRSTGIAYSAIHATMVLNTELGLELVDELLDFRMFPTTTHTADDIRSWLTATLVTYEILPQHVCGITPDGEAAGQKGIRMVPGLEKKADVCAQHNLQRVVMYMLGMAGPKASNPNPDARDLLKVNKRVVQLVHQVREVTYALKDAQVNAAVPAAKHLAPVRSHDIRWSNFYCQIERNNLLYPCLQPVISSYRREHAGESAIVEVESNDHYDTDDAEAQPRGPHFFAAATVTRREIGFDSDAWDANLELEAVMEYPYTLKVVMDKKRTVTRGQIYFLMDNMRRASAATKPLSIKLHPVNASLPARARTTASIASDSLRPLVLRAREQAVKQIMKRWFSVRPTDTVLVLIVLSKQGKASKILPVEWLQHAQAVYVQMLRATANRMNIGTRTSPRKQTTKKRHKIVFGGSDSDDDEADAAVDPTADQTTTTPLDPVVLERRAYESIDKKVVAEFTDSEGIVNEFKLMKKLQPAFPIHVALFSSLAAHLPTEQNAEETFSLAGKLSNDNTHTLPWFMATLVRIRENRKSGCEVTDDEVWDAYIDAFREPDEKDDDEMYASEPEESGDEDAEDEEDDAPITPITPAPAAAPAATAPAATAPAATAP